MSEQEPHLDRVPELAVRAPDLLRAPPFLDEAELPVERDRGGVVRPDAEGQLVQAAVARPLDRGRDERRADAASAPFARHEHPELAEAVAARADVQLAHDLAGRHR